jgi:hypothetical protein
MELKVPEWSATGGSATALAKALLQQWARHVNQLLRSADHVGAISYGRKPRNF